MSTYQNDTEWRERAERAERDLAMERDGFANVLNTFNTALLQQSAELVRLQAAQGHMDYCRAILNVSGDEVLAGAIERLLAELTETKQLLAHKNETAAFERGDNKV